MATVGAEDDVDFDFLVSYNNSSYMALANATQDKSVSASFPHHTCTPFTSLLALLVKLASALEASAAACVERRRLQDGALN